MRPPRLLWWSAALMVVPALHDTILLACGRTLGPTAALYHASRKLDTMFGRMALINCLLQSVISMGYFTALARAGCMCPAIYVAVAIFVLQVASSKLWHAHFRYGPMEWIWRRLAYGRRI